MSTRADFTADEWNTLFQAPAFAVIYIVQAGPYDPVVAYKQMMNGLLAIIETTTPGADTELVTAIQAAVLSGQRPHYPDVLPVDLAESRVQTLESCRKAVQLLAQRVPEHEADAFVAWLIAIGAAVAAVPDHSRRYSHGPESQIRLAQAALEVLADALRRA